MQQQEHSTDPGALDRLVIEKLATDSRRSIDVVERLYVREFSMLESQARIRDFLSVIALRRVREALQRDRAGQRAQPTP